MDEQLPLTENMMQSYAVPVMTLEQAKRQMLAKAEEGVSCPCCGRLVKLYRRKLNSEMAAYLCRLVRKYEQEPRYYSTRELCPALTKSATDGTYLVPWGIIEREPIPGQNSSGGKAGMYRPTKRGIDFAHDRVVVPARVHLLCGEVMGFSDDTIGIRGALGSKFSYEELMGGSGE